MNAIIAKCDNGAVLVTSHRNVMRAAADVFGTQSVVFRGSGGQAGHQPESRAEGGCTVPPLDCRIPPVGAAIAV